MIVLKDIKKTYYGKNIETNVLKGVDLMIHPGEFVCIYGSSGSGKSTLLNIVGVLDYATEGEYTLDGISIKNLNDKKMAEIRNRKIGFVFQAYHLVQEMNVLENIAVPLGYAGMSKKNRTARAQELLKIKKKSIRRSCLVENNREFLLCVQFPIDRRFSWRMNRLEIWIVTILEWLWRFYLV